jgi:uncharacterized membrane protein
MAKLRTSVVLLSGIFIILVLSGVVTAINSISRTPSSLTLSTGESGTYTVEVTPDSTTTGSFSVEIISSESNFSVVIRDELKNELASGNGGGVVKATVPYNSGSLRTFYVKVQNNGASSGDYAIQFTANDGKAKWTEANIYAGLTAIPEFTTLAIPAVLALLAGLFFLRRP